MTKNELTPQEWSVIWQDLLTMDEASLRDMCWLNMSDEQGTKYLIKLRAKELSK